VAEGLLSIQLSIDQQMHVRTLSESRERTPQTDRGSDLEDSHRPEDSVYSCQAQQIIPRNS
jgi:hypothetical protein